MFHQESLTNEPKHDKNQQNDCAHREDSDQPGYPPSLIRNFVVAKDPNLFHADSEKVNRKVQEEPQAEAAVKPRHQAEEKKRHRLTCA